MTRPRVLFVDDEAHALDGYRRLFQDRYEVAVESNPVRALRRLAAEPPFAAIVSDLRMPELDGIGFLARAGDLAPESTRILLTGYADFENAVQAVNQGHIFRFLSKPCPDEVLADALRDAVAQNELLRSSHELAVLRRLKRLMDAVLTGLSTLVERRDPYTAGHQRRVAKLAGDMAEAMGLSGERREVLRMAALIHDIGKVYVPSDFLNKPGRLSDAEFSIIRLHPEVGAEILASVDPQWPIAEIILQHHERLDGSGYPHGLKGADILPEARILAVADVADAMISQRPYRAALGQETAIDELRTGRGTVYDAEAVDACLALLESGRFSPDEFSPIPGASAT